eukprot:2587069-Lingulodinium_polyedra.AAC.1
MACSCHGPLPTTSVLQMRMRGSRWAERRCHARFAAADLALFVGEFGACLGRSGTSCGAGEVGAVA